jgi:excisionase family DNA binding protein
MNVSKRERNPVEPLAVDLREAARLTSLSVRTLRRHIRRGRLDVARVGRRVLIPMVALRQFVQGSRQR